MKKIILVLLSCLLLTGCGALDSKPIYEENEVDISSNTSLKDPVIEWCQVYNPNGFNTVTCLVDNPNKEDIDITYDLVYYKDNKEVARSEDFANFNISNTHPDVIWANYGIPKPEDVDDVKMEVKYVGKSYNKSIDMEYKDAGVNDRYHYYDVSFKSKPTVATVWFFLYYDYNKNGKLDKGELDVTSIFNAEGQKDKASFETNVWGDHYNAVEIFYNAY